MHKLKNIIRQIVIFSFLTSSMNFLYSESFRVHETKILNLELGTKVQTECKANDAIAIKIPKDLTFIQGIELSIKVPKEVSAWRDSVAWSFYNNISPTPTSDRIDYDGERMNVNTFANNVNYTIKIPLEKNHSIKNDNYSHLLENIPENKDGLVFLRLQLAMKGTDISINNASFIISAKPIYKNKGALKLQFKTPENKKLEALTIFIDEKVCSYTDTKILDLGTHTLNIISDFYRNEIRQFNIEQAKETILTIELKDITPVLRIASPNNAIIYIDNVEVENPENEIEISEGDHTIKFVIGDYELIKNINAKKGQNYKISLHFDAEISEEK